MMRWLVIGAWPIGAARGSRTNDDVHTRRQSKGASGQVRRNGVDHKGVREEGMMGNGTGEETMGGGNRDGRKVLLQRRRRWYSF